MAYTYWTVVYLRYEGQEQMIISPCEAQRLRAGLSHRTALDIFWMFTGGDGYRILVQERGWSSEEYQKWFGDMLMEGLLIRK